MIKLWLVILIISNVAFAGEELCRSSVDQFRSLSHYAESIQLNKVRTCKTALKIPGDVAAQDLCQTYTDLAARAEERVEYARHASEKNCYGLYR